MKFVICCNWLCDLGLKWWWTQKTCRQYHLIGDFAYYNYSYARVLIIFFNCSIFPFSVMLFHFSIFKNTKSIFGRGCTNFMKRLDFVSKYPSAWRWYGKHCQWETNNDATRAFSDYPYWEILGIWWDVI